jgi:hypothetical protein
MGLDETNALGAPESLGDDELKALLDRLREEESELSLQRRVLHGEIDLLHAEVRARLEKRQGKGTGHLTDVDERALAEILAHHGPPLELPDELAELE